MGEVLSVRPAPSTGGTATGCEAAGRGPLLLSPGRRPPPGAARAPPMLPLRCLWGSDVCGPWFGLPASDGRFSKGPQPWGGHRGGVRPSGETPDGVSRSSAWRPGPGAAGGPSDLALELQGRGGRLQVGGVVGGRGLAGQGSVQAVGRRRAGPAQEAGGRKEKEAQHLRREKPLDGAPSPAAPSPPPGPGASEALRTPAPRRPQNR